MARRTRRFIKPSIFYQCSQDSFNDAQALLKSKKTKKKNGAVYFAGFSLECYLKYCIFRNQNSVDEFEAKRLGHNLSELFSRFRKASVFKNKHIDLADINALLCNIDAIWYNEIRYVTKTIPVADCEKFVKEVSVIRRKLWEVINL